MTYDEYIKEVAKYKADNDVVRLLSYLKNWKKNDTDVNDLANYVENFFENSLIKNTDIYNNLYRFWTTFKLENIEAIDGMTMNERLYCFDLFTRFDLCFTQKAKDKIYAKLHAST